MNYYKHHIGDYAAATAHLSFAEDAAYSRLIRIYYRDERPLPVEVRAVQRLAGARSSDELEAVETVLREFFTLSDDGWRSKRCDEEIAKAQAQAETNREIAVRREATKRARIVVESCNESLDESCSSREPSHKPLASNQKEEQKPSSSGDDPKVSALDARLTEVTKDAVETWNESLLVLGGLAKVRAVGMDKRKTQVRRMLQTAREICQEQFGSPTIPRQFWVGLWREYAKDDFYAGRSGSGRGHENWRPDFEFLTRPATVLKLYDRVGEAQEA